MRSGCALDSNSNPECDSGLTATLKTESILVLEHNTLVANGTSVSIDQPAAQSRFAWTNNLVTNSTLGLSLSGLEGYSLNNAFFGNTTNYAGAARDGVAYVKTDCALTTPPALGPDSPCRGVGYDGLAPTPDWGRVRPVPPSIGAVE